MANKHKLDDAMYQCLMLTDSVAPRLNVLEEDEREAMGRRYSKVYGEKCSKEINTKQNGEQQRVKKMYKVMLAKGKVISWN